MKECVERKGEKGGEEDGGTRAERDERERVG